MFSNVSDAVLITRYREGSEAAATALYVRYAPLLRAKCRKHRLPECDFEDIYQEASLGFLYALNRYDESRGVPFAAFADVGVENCLKNFSASQYTQKMRVYRERLSLDAMSETLVSDRQNPEMLYLLKEQWSRISDSIGNKLSGLEKDILMLYLCGNNYKLIASKLGIPQKSVDNALQRVRRKLKNIAILGDGE